MENDQLVHSTSEMKLRLTRPVLSAGLKAGMSIRALAFNAILCLFVLLGALNLALIVYFTCEGQATLLGGHTPYLENAIFGSISLALMLAGVFGLERYR